jgi:hypothetical protein
MTIALVAPLCLCILAATPSKGTRLEQGQKAFADGEYTLALKALDAAFTEGADPEKVQLLRAQCFAALQDFARAEDAFALALEANPDASLDPTRVDPSVVKMLDGLRARTRGTVVVRSTPAGAEVTLDGKSLGAAPLEAQAVIGRHKLEAKWADGSLASTELLVRPRREIHLEWVQGVGAAGPVVTAEDHGLHPFGKIRAPLVVGGGFAGAFEMGVGFELPYFQAGLDLRLFPNFGATPRAGLVVPLVPVFSAFVDADVPLMFVNDGVAVGIGGEGGIEWHPFRFLGVFAAIGGEHFFTHPGFINVDRLTLAAGVRIRKP